MCILRYHVAAGFGLLIMAMLLFLLVYCCSLDGLIASIVLLICTSLWIKASAKWLNVNVNVAVCRRKGACLVHHGWIWISGSAFFPADLLYGSSVLRSTTDRLLSAVATTRPGEWRYAYTKICVTMQEVIFSASQLSGTF